MSYQIAKARWATTAGLIAICASLGACSTLPVQSKTLTVYNLSSGDAYIEFEQPNSIGDKILWRSDVQTLGGESLGIGSGHCTRLDADANFFCSFTVTLDGRGIIAGHGIQRTEPLESTFPIIGGTGEFEGIVGEIKSTPIEDRARFRYDMTYSLSP